MSFNTVIHHVITVGLVVALFALLSMLVYGLWATRPWKGDNAKYWKDDE